MKILRTIGLGLAFLTGCGPQKVDVQGQPSQVSGVTRLEAHLPLKDAPVLVFSDGGQPPAVVNADSWVERTALTGQTLEGLRDHAQRVGAEDGFALTEAEIQALAAKYDELVLY